MVALAEVVRASYEEYEYCSWLLGALGIFEQGRDQYMTLNVCLNCAVGNLGGRIPPVELVWLAE